MTDEGYLTVGMQRLHYRKWGCGSHLLLAFHGYGNDASLFGTLKPYLADAYTVVAVDLPFHGKTEWNGDAPMEPEDLLRLAESVLQATGLEQMSLIGYSLGGRVCLSLVGLMPERISRVVLLASDGLAPSPFYFFVTRTWPGKLLFRLFLETGASRRIVEICRRLGVLGAQRYRFVTHYTGTVQARRFLLQVWPVMRRLIPDRTRIRRAIRRFHIPVCIFCGIRDRVIPPHTAAQFARDLPEVSVTVLEEGHYLFQPQALREITRCLL